MFPLMPVQGIHIVGRKHAVGKHKGYSCVNRPNVGITTIPWDCEFVTLRAAILNLTPHPHQNWILPTLFLNRWWHWCWWWSTHIHQRRYWWWWCCHSLNRVEQLQQVSCLYILHCLFKQFPPLCYHLVAGQQSSNSWNTCKIHSFKTILTFSTFKQLIILPYSIDFLTSYQFPSWSPALVNYPLHLPILLTLLLLHPCLLVVHHLQSNAPP